ncbi:hypothetical protein RRG08_045516 [Elysia crispata]|uniref:Uncharacterized protein n=1 Tax=Elysia crispata TaxID=231223 RepID=A0AAE0ZWP2_9GAST|nr:hypothetical protein RRG08_045516 [Elysia crispata]
MKSVHHSRNITEVVIFYHSRQENADMFAHAHLLSSLTFDPPALDLRSVGLALKPRVTLGAEETLLLKVCDYKLREPNKPKGRGKKNY